MELTRANLPNNHGVISDYVSQTQPCVHVLLGYAHLNISLPRIRVRDVTRGKLGTELFINSDDYSEIVEEHANAYVYWCLVRAWIALQCSTWR